jgi:hypothetical protein
MLSSKGDTDIGLKRGHMGGDRVTIWGKGASRAYCIAAIDVLADRSQGDMHIYDTAALRPCISPSSPFNGKGSRLERGARVGFDNSQET